MRRLVAIVALALVAAGCSGAGSGLGGELEGTRWVLRSFDDGGSQALLEGEAYADAEFISDRLRGFAGCSDFDAVYRSVGRSIIVSAPVTTFQSCGEDADAFQATYLGLLEQTRNFTARNDHLTMFGPDGMTLLVFDAGPKNPLLGKWTVDSYADASGSQVEPLPDTTLTATFRLTNVNGSAGCNTFDGTYSTNGNVVAIGRLATTRMACPEEVLAQETAFLEALGGVAFVQPRAASLLLTDRAGNVSVALSRPGDAVEPSQEPSAEPEATETPEATEAPTATPSPTPEPTATPRPTPSPRPTPTPTPPATAAPSVAPTAAPTLAPPSPMPETATCSIDGAGGSTATIVYPADWSTVAEPAALACRYFDPEPITVPEDPLALEAAVTIGLAPDLAYADAVIAATDPGTWEVTTATTYSVAGFPATLVEATSTNEASGHPVGTIRYAYLLDLGPGGTVSIGTLGTAGEEFDTNTATVDLIAAASTVIAPS